MPALTLRRNQMDSMEAEPIQKATSKRFSISFTSSKHATIDAEITAMSTTQGKTKQVNKLKLFVHMIKDGPAYSAASTDDSENSESVDPEADAPMPRKKTSYERYLKHQVRVTQVKNYNELVERDEMEESRRKSTDSVKSAHSGFMRLRRNRSGDKLIDVEQTLSTKKVRFLVKDELIAFGDE